MHMMKLFLIINLVGKDITSNTYTCLDDYFIPAPRNLFRLQWAFPLSLAYIPLLRT